MIFGNKAYVWLLLIGPLAMILVYIGYRFKAQRMKRFISMTLWSKIIPSLSYTRRFWKQVLMILGIMLTVLAFLRPQYGLRFETVERKGQDVFIVVDTSLSMMAPDIHPNRFSRAKQEIRGLVESLKGDRVGLIVFSGTAFVQCPLTTDYGALNLFLNDINVGSVSTPGTDLATAIKTARLAFNRQSKHKQKRLIIISDGESFENDPVESAKVAAKDNIVIFTVGVGTPSGEPIPVLESNGRMTSFKKDKQGKVVVSRLNEILLQEVAEITGGQYFSSSSGALAMSKIYRLISKMEKELLEDKLQKQHEDRYYWFLIPALLCLLAEFVINERRPINNQWKGRL